MLNVTAVVAVPKKFAVHFRLDTNEPGHEHNVAGLDALMQECMLEPVRITVWKHLMSRYYITDERGPGYAQMYALLGIRELVYQGPL